MSTQFLRRHRSLFVALPVIVGLLATGCSSSDASTQATDTTAVVDTEASTTTTTTVVATTTTIKAPTTTAKPAAPSTTMAAPPVSSIPPISLAPNITVLLKPTITSLTAVQSKFTCAQALIAKHAGVSWTSSFAASVTMQTTDDSFPGKPANGSILIPLKCGETIDLRFLAIGSNGQTGGSKVIHLVVES